MAQPLERDELIRALSSENQPHSLLITPRSMAKTALKCRLTRSMKEFRRAQTCEGPVTK